MGKLKIKRYKLSGAKHCFIVKSGGFIDLIKKRYGRDDICLKVFDEGEPIENEKDIKNFKWGDDPKGDNPRVNTTLWEATQIQNICSWEGLAPRVYGIETVVVAGKVCPVQVTEYLNDKSTTQEKADEVYDKIIEVGKKYNFGIDKRDVSTRDAMGNKLVDFQTFAFIKPYDVTTRNIYIEHGRYGRSIIRMNPF